MTADQKRNKVASSYSKIIGRNIYSQDLNKRECVFTKYTDGKYYSDCSSSIRLSYKDAKILSNIGGNTVAQFQSSLGKKVDITIKNGIPTNISKLRVGDCFYFAGTDSSRAYADFCGHVEMVYSVTDNKVILCGHGSDNPSYKDMNMYCKARYMSKTSTSRGNKGLIGIIRFIPDDVNLVIKATKPISTVSAKSKSSDVLWLQMKANKVISKVSLKDEKGIKIPKLIEDGKYGPKCQIFVKAFWKLLGWTSSSTTGNAGLKTISALSIWK